MRYLFTMFFALAFFALSGPAWAAGTLTVFSWSDYIDPAVIESFEKKYDVKVRLDYYESNEEMAAKLQSGGLGQYDIILPSTYIMTSLKALDLIQPINHQKLSNLKNLDPAFTKMAADPGNKFTVPYQWGTSGLAVRSNDISQVKPSFGLLFDPKAEIGTFVIFDTARDAIGSALIYLGYSLNTVNIKEIEEAVKLLIATKQRSAFMGFDNGMGGLNKVLGKVATVAQAYNGDVLRANVDDDSDIHYIMPEEGCEIWADLLAIPRKAPNLENAYLFLNYVLEPEIGAKLATYNKFATANAAAMAFIPEEDRKNPALYPDMDKIKNMEYIEDLGPSNRLYDEAWTMIKTK